MLPDVAPVAGDAVGAVVEVLAVQAAHGAVEVPLAFLLFGGKEFQRFLVLLLLRFEVAFGDALDVAVLAERILRLRALRVFLKPCQLFFVKNALGFALAHALLSCESS